MSEIAAFIATVLIGTTIGFWILTALAIVLVNLLDGWRPFRTEHREFSEWCPTWQWDITCRKDTPPCYHETPDGPRCCNCGLRPPREKPEHGNKLKETN